MPDAEPVTRSAAGRRPALEFPAELLYSESDEWVRVEGDTAVLGITDYAQEQLGDIVFVELPAVGRVLTVGAPFGVVESIKAVSDLYAPVAGEVVAINEGLADAPERVNDDPYGDGWLVRVRLAAPLDASTLLTADAYRALRADGA